MGINLCCRRRKSAGAWEREVFTYALGVKVSFNRDADGADVGAVIAIRKIAKGILQIERVSTNGVCC